MTHTLISRPLTEFTDHQPLLESLVRTGDALFVREDVGFAGVGVLAGGSHAEVQRFLRDLRIDGDTDRPGVGGVAIGWHSFDGTKGWAVVPQVSFVHTETGETWVTFPADAESLVVSALNRDDAPTIGSASFSVRPGVSLDRYLAAVVAARDAVRRGDIQKAVIARDVIVESSVAVDLTSLLGRLRASFGSCYRYLVDGLVGASPELLVERRGDVIRSLPLAGTTPRTGDPANDARLAAELRASEKNQVEHRIVIEMVHDTLLQWCSYLDWQPEPDIVAVANVQHLGTRVEGRLSNPLPHVFELVAALSPTPALGGHPREAALQLIAECEGMDRGRYGGAVGWYDGRGDGTWAVTIRCAEFSADWRRARLFAGGGIVADSVPGAELAETQAKFQAMLAAIIRP
jgi:isochorismate synthase